DVVDVGRPGETWKGRRYLHLAHDFHPFHVSLAHAAHAHHPHHLHHVPVHQAHAVLAAHHHLHHAAHRSLAFLLTPHPAHHVHHAAHPVRVGRALVFLLQGGFELGDFGLEIADLVGQVLAGGFLVWVFVLGGISGLLALRAAQQGPGCNRAEQHYCPEKR